MASRYWVGGTGNWDTSATTHWSATSGGASGASNPGVGDDVILDAASGGGVVTMIEAITVNSITMGAFTGTLNSNGQTVNAVSLANTGTGIRILTLGASAINLTFAGLALDTTISTNLTVDPGTSVITLSGAGASFVGGGKTYYDLIFTGGGQVSVLDNVWQFHNLSSTGAATKTEEYLLFLANSVGTITGTLTVHGNSSVNRVWVAPNTSQGPVSISAANVSFTNTDFMDIAASGTADWDLSAITGLSGNCGGNSGITFTAAVPQHWVKAAGAGGNWSDATAWTSRVPLPQDSVSVDNAFGVSQTITGDMRHLGASIDFTGATWTTSLTWANSVANNIFGSLKTISGLSHSGGNAMTFRGRGTHTVQTFGMSFTRRFLFTAPGAHYSLIDNLTTTARVDVFAGTVDLNGHDLTASVLFGTSLNAFGQATFIQGTGTVTLTSNGGAAAVLSFTNNIIVSAASGTIKFTDTTNGAITIIGGGNTFGTLWFARSASTGDILITDSNTFHPKDTGTAAHSWKITAGTTQTITGWDVFGASNAARITWTSATAAFHTLVTTLGVVSGGNLNISYSHASPNGVFYAQTSVDSGNNTGWIFHIALIARSPILRARWGLGASPNSLEYGKHTDPNTYVPGVTTDTHSMVTIPAGAYFDPHVTTFSLFMKARLDQNMCKSPYFMAPRIWANTENGFTWIFAGDSSTNPLSTVGTFLLGADANYSSFSWDVGTWHTICITSDLTTVKMYADGVLILTATVTPDANTVGNWLMGNSKDNKSIWSGQISTTRLYKNKVCTPTEVANYQTGSIPASPLVEYLFPDSDVGTAKLTDSSGNGYDGVITLPEWRRSTAATARTPIAIGRTVLSISR